jgi:hypothetical protein
MSKNVIDAACRLMDAVEFDVNATYGKGANGGLVSDDTIRALASLCVLISMLDEGAHVEGR